MLGPTDTTNGPDDAPDGIVMTIDPSVQALAVTSASFSNTTLLPSEAPNPDPEINTWVPTDTVVAETVVMIGPGVEGVLRETLSKVAVARAEVLRLLTPKPM